MSTSSAIARRAGDGWEGVYHHFDGYPDGLGCYLFRRAQQAMDEPDGLQGWLNDILSHTAGWSHLYPCTEEEPTCYCHGRFAERDNRHPDDYGGWETSESHRPWNEWVYIIVPERSMMVVLRHGMCPSFEEPCMTLVAHIDLRGSEPNWFHLPCLLNDPMCDCDGDFTTWVDSLLPRKEVTPIAFNTRDIWSPC